MKIRTRIIASALAVVAFVCTIFLVYILNKQASDAEASMERRMQRTHARLQLALPGPLYDGNVAQLNAYLDSVFRSPHLLELSLTEFDGDIRIARKREPVLAGGRTIATTVSVKRGVDELGEVRTVYTTARIERQLADARNEILSLTLALMLAVAVVIYRVASGVTRPVDRLTVAAKAIADGDLDQRIDLVGAEEVVVLGRSFQRMRDAIRDKLVALELKNRELSLEITQRQEAEQERDRLVSTLEATTDIVSMADPEGNILYFNAAGRRALGISSGDVSSSAIPQFHPPWARDLIFQVGMPAAVRDGVWSGETAILRPDGGSTPVSQVIVSHKDDNGQLQYLSTIIRDISERKRVEAELQRFKTTLDLTHDCVFMFDPHTLKFFYVNEGATQQVGYTADEMRAMTPVDIKPDYDEAAFRALLAPLLSGERRSITFETVHRHRDGHLIDVEIALQYVSPVVDSPRFIAIVRDITERKEAERALRELAVGLEARVKVRTAELEAANRELEAFSYSVSHDLRAPLRAIDGFSRILVEDYGSRFDDEARDYFDRVLKAVQRMGNLIDDLLKLSRVTRAELHPSSVDLSKLAREVCRELSEGQPERQVEVSIAAGLSTHGDPQLLRVALSNLLENAWKYTGKTPRACIEFASVERDGKPVFYVRDNGAGFEMQYVDKLFGAFQRLHAEHDFPGTGIGLATVSRIIRRHGGEVWAEGETDHGATFYFTLPESSH